MPLTMPVSTAHSTCGYLLRGLAERAVLGDERERGAVRLGVRGEAVRGQRVGDRRDRGLHRRWPSPGSMRAAIARPYS